MSRGNRLGKSHFWESIFDAVAFTAVSTRTGPETLMRGLAPSVVKRSGVLSGRAERVPVFLKQCRFPASDFHDIFKGGAIWGQDTDQLREKSESRLSRVSSILLHLKN